MAGITDGFRDIFLAGVGALSLGADKSKEVLDDLIARGQVSVEQGRQINEELRHRSVEAGSKVLDDTIRAWAKTLSPEDREDLAAHIAEVIKNADTEPEPAAEAEPIETEAETVEDVTEEAAEVAEEPAEKE